MGGGAGSGRNAGGLAGETEHRAGGERKGLRSCYIYQHQHRAPGSGYTAPMRLKHNVEIAD